MQRSGRGVVLAVGLVAVVALVVWLAWGERELVGRATVPVAASGANDRPAPSFAADVPATPLHAAVPAEEQLPSVGAATASGAARLVVRVTWAADGAPAEGILLHLVAGEQPTNTPIDGRTDAQGLWQLEPAPLGTVGVYSDRDGAATGKVEAGRVTELALALPPGTLVKGRVVDPNGASVPRAEIWLSDATAWMSGAVVAAADDAGRFEVRGVCGDRWIGARGAGWQPSALTEIERDAPAEMEVELRLGPAGGTVRGVVFGARGEPLRGAFVQVGPSYGWPGPDPPVGAERGHGPPPFRLRTAADGAFAMTDVPPGVVPLEVRADAWTPFETTLDVVAGEVTELQVLLEPGATVQGTVRDAAGAAVAGASIATGTRPDEPGYVRVRSGADGRYMLRDPPKLAHSFVARKNGVGEAQTTLVIEPGATLAWDPVLSAGLQIVGHVSDESATPVEGLLVTANVGAHFTGKIASSRVTADGRFAIANCEDAEYRVAVSEKLGGPELAVAESVRPGGGEVSLTIPASARKFATVTLRVVDRRGVLPPALMVSLTADGQPFSQTGQVDAASGAVRFDSVAAGDHHLQARAQELAPVTEAVAGLRPGEHRDLGTIVLDDPGRVLLHVGLPAGVTPQDVLPILDRVEGHGAVAFELPVGTQPEWIAKSVAPGDYLLSLNSNSGDESHPFIVPMGMPLHVDAGIEKRVDAFAEQGVAQNIKLTTARPVPPVTSLVVLAVDGSEVLSDTVDWYDADGDGHDDDGYTSFIGRPGAYTLRVTCEGKPLDERELKLSGAVNIAPEVSVVVP
jgi:hypothetical protein